MIEQNVKLRKKPKKRRRGLIMGLLVAVVFAELYCFAVFSNIPFIRKWRNIYIETAMDTLNHKWLATFFIPKGVIDDVMAEREAVIRAQQELQSRWENIGSNSEPDVPDKQEEPDNPDKPDKPDVQQATKGEREFFRLFSELDARSFLDYVDEHPEVLENGYENIYINCARLTDSGTSMRTVQGDEVLAVDARHGILIVRVAGEGYVGKLAIVKDPADVRVGVASTLGTRGQSVKQIADRYNAVLAINASGFADENGVGHGGTVVGLLISEGVKYNERTGGTYLNIGFGKDDRLYIGASEKDVEFRDAVQFVPALIVDGENVIAKKNLSSNSMGFGLQPRTVIGQAEDGTVLLLTIDGRQVGYSIGTTVVECAAIMERYGAVQAANLDGGSSTVMVYRGEEITKPANGIKYGRNVPDAIIVGTLDDEAA